ncbi:hypothetical protein FPANT_4240 [Fusarium pseudoanthophilum]|uniref:Uncharacterized protein n=1 Tax=Fusarium pseudoanthophilum TaxID=48495 RepID=A0A8H5USQ1_9HYPO|nr:hypothetical protein FPANT_4240 [Fusarium pseudoanthophilum]
MPAPPRPSRGRPPAFSKQDEDLWKAYTKALQTKFFSNLDSKNEIFYAAPIGMMGIPAGANISQEITNKGVYDIGDAVMQLDAPVFDAGSKKYSQRLQEVLGAARLGQNRDLGAEKRMNDIQTKLRRLNSEYTELSRRAIESYVADEDKDNMPFGKWVPMNYPSFVAISNEKQSAAATEASLRAQIAGPGASQLNGQRQRLFSACELDKTNPDFNMPCAPSFGNIVNGSSDIPQQYTGFSRPTYTIENSYRDTVGNWIRDAGRENKLNLTFNINDAKSENWDKFGFVNVNANSPFTYFFKASYTQDHQMKEEYIMAQEVGSEVSVQLTAAQAGVFTVKPGDWDVPNIMEEYRDFRPEIAREIGPAARVDQVILAYKVVMKLSFQAKFAERIYDITQKAKDTGGSVSFFGLEVRFGGGSKDEVNISGSSIEIRKDLGYPVLLGAKGKKLPAPLTGR